MLLRVASAAAVALGVLASALSGAPPASGATCAERVIADWRDGHVDRKYSAGCLRAALRSLPEDLRMYGTAEEDISRALNDALVRAKARTAAASAVGGRALLSRPAPATSKPRTPTRAKRARTTASRSLSNRPAKATSSSAPSHGVAAAVATRAAAESDSGVRVGTFLLVAAAALGACAIAVSVALGARRRRAS